MFDVANMLKINEKNKQLWASKHKGLFSWYALEQGMHLISTGKLQVLSCSPNVHKSFRL